VELHYPVTVFVSLIMLVSVTKLFSLDILWNYRFQENMVKKV
jgi:hypothetical protein